MKTSKIIIKLILRLHNFFYRLSGIFSIKVEAGIHPKHRLMNYHKFFTDNIDQNDTVLDVGCGNGFLTFDIAKKAKKVVGIDLNEENIRFAKEKFPAFNIKYLIGNITKDIPNEKYDVIVLSNVLEHIENRIEFLDRIRRLAPVRNASDAGRPKILIRVPMINRDWITLYKKELGLEWRLDKNHYIEYTLETFKDELKRADLKIQNYSVQFGEIWAIIK